MLDTKESNTEVPEIELSEIKIEKKYSSCNNCIICLDEFIDKNYLEMPNDNSLCSCKYDIHSDCLEKCNDKCPICLTKMKSNEELEENMLGSPCNCGYCTKQCVCAYVFVSIGVLISIISIVITCYYGFLE